MRDVSVGFLGKRQGPRGRGLLLMIGTIDVDEGLWWGVHETKMIMAGERSGHCRS